MTYPGSYRFKRVPKMGRKGKKGQTKCIRMGSRHHGATTGHGSARRPF
jgi:hypothetical protein